MKLQLQTVIKKYVVDFSTIPYIFTHTDFSILLNKSMFIRIFISHLYP